MGHRNLYIYQDDFLLLQGAFWGLMISLVVGLIRMVLDFAMPAPFCGSQEEDTRPAVLKDVNFLHFAILLSFVSLISTVVISFLTEPRPPEKVGKAFILIIMILFF